MLLLILRSPSPGIVSPWRPAWHWAHRSVHESEFSGIVAAARSYLIAKDIWLAAHSSDCIEYSLTSFFVACIGIIFASLSM